MNTHRERQKNTNSEIGKRGMLAAACFMTLALCVFFPGLTFSDDGWLLKFNVPVEIKNAPEEVKGIGVTVRVFTADQSLVAWVEKTIPMDPSGNFSGVISAEIYPKDVKKDIKEADNYTVTFGYQYGQFGGPFEEWPGVDDSPVDPLGYFIAKPGTKAVTKVKGPLVEFVKPKKSKEKSDSAVSGEVYTGVIPTAKIQFEGTRVYHGEITTPQLMINGMGFEKFKLNPLEMTGMREKMILKPGIKIDLKGKKQAEGEMPAGRAMTPGKEKTQKALPGGAQAFSKGFGAGGQKEEIR